VVNEWEHLQNEWELVRDEHGPATQVRALINALHACAAAEPGREAPDAVDS
jgi:hypothetical protein